MPDYLIFGRILRSDMSLPELPVMTGGTPDWYLRRGAAAPFPDPEPLGREPVAEGVEVVLERSGEELRLHYSDTGDFRISRRGRLITWTPPLEPPPAENVRKDVLGRVLAVALHAGGVLTLHGSGVVMGGLAVIFLAPKRHGKSTLASALVDTGARLLGDDILAVLPGSLPLVLPGVPAVQLWRDSAARVAVNATGLREGTGSAKRLVGWAAEQRAARPAPLAAIYFLSPTGGATAATIRRERLPARIAALALLGNTKVGALLGRDDARRLLAQAVAFAERAPIYRLHFPRAFDELPRLTEALWRWHPDAARAVQGLER